MRKNAIIKEIFSYIKIIFFTWLSVYITVHFLFRPVIVEGRSMFPTLHNNDVGVSNIIGFKLNGVKRFDIVVLDIAENSDLIVKRVIGLPGEEVEYRNDKLYINGEYLPENFLTTEYLSEYLVENPLFTPDFLVILAADEYYCLGDNRPRSMDSRFFGPIKYEQIVSKSVFILYPFTNFLKGN